MGSTLSPAHATAIGNWSATGGSKDGRTMENGVEDRGHRAGVGEMSRQKNLIGRTWLYVIVWLTS
eukprot:2212432-Amphidinium_carterae.1